MQQIHFRRIYMGIFMAPGTFLKHIVLLLAILD